MKTMTIANSKEEAEKDLAEYAAKHGMKEAEA